MEDNRKRKLEENKMNNSKKRKITHDDDSDDEDYDMITQVILQKINKLNETHDILLNKCNTENSKYNKDNYYFHSNVYKNEEMDLNDLFKEYNFSIDMFKDKINHDFGILPVYKEESSEDSEEESSEESNKGGKEYIPFTINFDSIFKKYSEKDDKEYNESEEMYEEMENLIKKSNLPEDKKKFLYEENKKINDILKNKLPDKLNILNMNIPIHIKAELLQKLNLIDNSHNPEKMKEWMDRVLKIPFGKYSKLPIKDLNNIGDVSNFIRGFHNILNKAIYGQNKVKETLIEIITKWITTDGKKGKCIAINGPPGVGKTSLIREGLAKALNRPFCSFSLAGVSDENYLTGFPFTYEGANCGRFAKMLMDSKTMDPIIFMDELDKVDTKKSMSVYNKLIEVTDFSQNHEIEDHYFGSNIKLDMSKCIFVFSLNNIHLVDPILRDRLEVINVDGFELNEKIKIAQKYLIPRELSNYHDKLSFSNKDIKHIINKVKKEKGVRNLQRGIEKILRKLNVLKYYNETSYKLKDNNFKISSELINLLLKDNSKFNQTILRMYN